MSFAIFVITSDSQEVNSFQYSFISRINSVKMTILQWPFTATMKIVVEFVANVRSSLSQGLDIPLLSVKAKDSMSY